MKQKKKVFNFIWSSENSLLKALRRAGRFQQNLNSKIMQNKKHACVPYNMYLILSKSFHHQWFHTHTVPDQQGLSTLFKVLIKFKKKNPVKCIIIEMCSNHLVILLKNCKNNRSVLSVFSSSLYPSPFAQKDHKAIWWLETEDTNHFLQPGMNQHLKWMKYCLGQCFNSFCGNAGIDPICKIIMAPVPLCVNPLLTSNTTQKLHKRH